MRLQSLLVTLILTLFSFASAHAAYTPYPVSSGQSKEFVQRANLANNGSCSVSSQSGSWISASSHPFVGTCVWNFTGFTSTPACVCTAALGNRTCTITVASSSSINTLTTTANTASDIDANFYIICMGPH